jgi:two-component system CheB/CheR fusion protein
VQQFEPAVTQAVRDGVVSDATLDALDRRGRRMKCRVRVSPLLHDDRSTHGAVIVLEDRTAAPTA